MSDRIISITDQEFDAEVLQAQQPVLVYFWASWCGPCRLMSPIISAIADNYGDRLKVVKMEVDPNPNTVAAYSVEGVPAFRLIHNQTVLESEEGALSKQKVEEMVSPHLSAAT
jgi:thioredoxin 1